MSGKFSPEESFTMEPERVQPLEERSFVRGHCGPWEKECKEPGRHFALKEAKVCRWHCWPAHRLRDMSDASMGVRVGMSMAMDVRMRMSDGCSVGILAFQHSLV